MAVEPTRREVRESNGPFQESGEAILAGHGVGRVEADRAYAPDR